MCVCACVHIMACLVFLMWHIFLCTFHDDPYCAAVVKMWQNTKFDCTYRIWERQKKSFFATVSCTYDSILEQELSVCLHAFWTMCVVTAIIEIPHPTSILNLSFINTATKYCIISAMKYCITAPCLFASYRIDIIKHLYKKAHWWQYENNKNRTWIFHHSLFLSLL